MSHTLVRLGEWQSTNTDSKGQAVGYSGLIDQLVLLVLRGGDTIANYTLKCGQHACPLAHK